MYKPGKNQLLIRNHAAAINPVDWKVQDHGMIIIALTTWAYLERTKYGKGYFIENYPMVLGEDIAGEVTEVGEGVTQFKKGDRVIS